MSCHSGSILRFIGPFRDCLLLRDLLDKVFIIHLDKLLWLKYRSVQAKILNVKIFGVHCVINYMTLRKAVYLSIVSI